MPALRVKLDWKLLGNLGTVQILTFRLANLLLLSLLWNSLSLLGLDWLLCDLLLKLLWREVLRLLLELLRINLLLMNFLALVKLLMNLYRGNVVLLNDELLLLA